MDTMQRLGLGPKKKQKVADEIALEQFRAERVRRARRRATRPPNIPFAIVLLGMGIHDLPVGWRHHLLWRMSMGN